MNRAVKIVDRLIAGTLLATLGWAVLLNHRWLWPSVAASVVYLTADTVIDTVRARRRDRANQQAAVAQIGVEEVGA